MSTSEQTAGAHDRRAVLSTLWIFVLLNFLYGDLAMMIFHPEAYRKIAAGMTEGMVLGATVLIEILIAMVLLSRVLKYRANRWANVVVGVVGTAFVISTLTGRPPAFYLFLSVLEIACTVFIVWFAWTWPRPEAGSFE